MTNSKTLSAPLSPPIPKGAILSSIIVAVLGFADAVYLTAQHYMHAIPPCTVVHGCEQVLTSRFAVVAGIPLALFGALFYFTVIVMAIAYLDFKNDKFLWTWGGLVVNGFVVTLILLYIQAFVLGAYCLYCLFSAAISATLFAIAGAVWLKRQKFRKENPVAIVSGEVPRG